MNLAESSSVKVSDEQYNSLDDAKQCVFNKSFFLLNSSILNKCFQVNVNNNTNLKKIINGFDGSKLIADEPSNNPETKISNEKPFNDNPVVDQGVEGKKSNYYCYVINYVTIPLIKVNL